MPDRDTTRSQGAFSGALLSGTLFLSAAIFNAGCGEHSTIADPPELSSQEGIDPGASIAINSARSSVLENRSSFTAWVALGETYLAHNLFEKAQLCFEQAILLDPSSAKTTYLLAICHDALNHPEQRNALVNQAIERDPSNPIPRWRAASWALSEGRISEASSLAESALNRQGSDENAIKILAKVRLAQGDPNGAIALLVPLVQGSKADLYARYLLGRAFQATGEKEKARRQLTLAGKARENFQDQWREESNTHRADLVVGLTTLDALLNVRDITNAQITLENLSRRYGAIRELELRRAELMARNAKPVDALAINGALLEAHPEWGPAVTHRANLFLMSFMQDPARGSDYLRAANAYSIQATELAPGSLNAWEILAKSSSIARDFPTAPGAPMPDALNSPLMCHAFALPTLT